MITPDTSNNEDPPKKQPQENTIIDQMNSLRPEDQKPSGSIDLGPNTNQ
jgi:hypothetical protein